MADEHGRQQREFDVDAADLEDGPVRILPDDTSASEVEQTRPPLRHGTLYTPAVPPPTTVSGDRMLKPYDHTPLTRSRPMGETYAPRQREREEQGVRDAEHSGPPEPLEQPRTVVVRRGPSACAIIAGTFSLLAVACALLAFATLQGGLSGLSKLTGVFPSFGSLVSTPTVTIDTTRPTVIDSVRALSKLETVHYQLEKVVTGKSSGPLPDFFTSDKILLVAHGEVVAGVDLSKLSAGDIVTGTDVVTITLPAPEILYSKLDNDKTYVYDRQTGVFSKPNPNLESQMRNVAEQEIRNASMEDGIIDKARANAEQVVRTLVTGLGYKDVRFTEGP